ncbi:uncharacterized protein FOMMEDRAFT_157145 [Fomitiporia mediterranea MF3/22]|uniref:uncharacterized protein n=1 Tax=Fomitiporia mediterranea (strain MF3/22) TaxID=694068 RepID=UPI000440976F|nr:uncharacterized protein FOMMEDRAFT_157145 [Fomitiporia mediterranea MF3/22]EJD01980.1 hypothetical protein FOMMEDRAFT_157145 [Fomitiporia mediterranea MF3/22]
MYTICTTEESVSKAVEVLADAEYIILDCEGRDLGSASGALSLISLGTPHASDIFLFDILLLPHHALQILFNAVLSLTPAARAKTKVVWDGRMDYSELFFSYTCPIENVLDLQLADILSRAKRGQNDKQRLDRLSRRAFPRSEIRKLQLEEVHALNGMDGARPLSSELLSYAASDIVRIAGLYDHFLGHGYLEPMEQLWELSARYVSIHRTSGKPDDNDIFVRGPCLPLSISLSETSGSTVSIVDGSGRACSGCRRTIAIYNFPFVSLRKKHKSKIGDDNQERSPMCKICMLILAKIEYKEGKKAAKTLVENVRCTMAATQVREG